jgi:hypothetical protein
VSALDTTFIYNKDLILTTFFNCDKIKTTVSLYERTKENFLKCEGDISMICPKCQRPLDDEAIYCPMCGCATGNPIPRGSLPDKANGVVAFLTFLLSFFFPEGVIFGFALWAAKTDLQPKTARTYGLCALLPWFLRWLIPFIIKVIITIFVVLLIAIAGTLAALYYNGIIVI